LCKELQPRCRIAASLLGKSWDLYVYCAVCLSAPCVATSKAPLFQSRLYVLQVNTTGTGYAVLTYVAGGLDYDFHLFNVSGLKSIELHVGAQTEHGDVATVFYKTAFANGSQISQGRVAAGTLTSDDLIRPFVLPLGEHLDTSVVFDR